MIKSSASPTEIRLPLFISLNIITAAILLLAAEFMPSNALADDIIYDGRFIQPGTYFSDKILPAYKPGTSPNVGGSSPSPWPSAEYAGQGSQIVVYDDRSKRPDWPKPYEWSKYAAAFTSVNDGAAHTLRAQVHDNKPFGPGSDIYLTFAIYVPSSLARVFNNESDWFLVQENFGAPYNGSPATAVDIVPMDNTLYLAGDYRGIHCGWKTPLPLDQWVTITEHFVFSKYPQQGVWEAWVNGVKQTFDEKMSPKWMGKKNYIIDGQYLSDNNTKAHIATMLSDDDGHDGIWLNNYRKGQGTSLALEAVTIFHAGAVVGRTLQSVDPKYFLHN